MFLLGFLDALLLGASLTVYGVLFLPVSALTALWVRRGDLLTAPVVVPIAFAAGLLTVADGGGGFLGTLMGLVTALSIQAGWLYGGTLIAGVIVLVRRARIIRRRRRS
jgi:TRAP-type C4-dicarboxylate transport system permease small subunit